MSLVHVWKPISYNNFFKKKKNMDKNFKQLIYKGLWTRTTIVVLKAPKQEREREMGEGNTKKEEGFKPKIENPDLFPAKKRLVKKMMFDYIVKKFSVLCFFCQTEKAASRGSCHSKTSKPKIKRKQIYQCTTN